jgi:hypothetical protein
MELFENWPCNLWICGAESKGTVHVKTTTCTWMLTCLSATVLPYVAYVLSPNRNIMANLAVTVLDRSSPGWQFFNHKLLYIARLAKTAAVFCSVLAEIERHCKAPLLPPPRPSLPGFLLTAAVCSAKQTVKLATVERNNECELITKSPVSPSVIEVNFQNDRISKCLLYFRSLRFCWVNGK